MLQIKKEDLVRLNSELSNSATSFGDFADKYGIDECAMEAMLEGLTESFVRNFLKSGNFEDTLVYVLVCAFFTGYETHKQFRTANGSNS